jgi:hypothetical protein
MKIFWLILSIYLVSLSVLPCSDKEECDITVKVEQASISKTNTHDQHTHEKEHCPPFCICSCCGAHSYDLQITLIHFKKNKDFALEKKQICTYAFIYSNEYSSKIWQPPRLS